MQNPPPGDHLLFVYNADSGLFNSITDIAHKILAPDTYSCQLCALTHGHFKVRQEWVAFLETLPLPCEFLHRDEFLARHPQQTDAFPAIFRSTDSGLEHFVSREEINQCRDMAALRELIRGKLAGDWGVMGWI
jgi:hypothetical protein